MIEPRIIIAENKRYGAVGAASYTRGEFCVLSGSWSAARIASLEMGQAEVGMLRLIRSTGGHQNVIGKVFPIDKLTVLHEDGDSTYDTLSSGDQVMFFRGPSQLATDCYNATNLSTSTAQGTDLYVNTTGWLDTSGGTAADSSDGVAIATLVRIHDVGTVNFFNGTPLYTKDLLVYDLL